MIWQSGWVVKNIFRFGTLQISWRKSDKSCSTSCTPHSSRASITIRIVDLDACSQCQRGWMIKSQNWSWSCFPLAFGSSSRASPIWRVTSLLHFDNWNAMVLKKSFADLWSFLLLENKKLVLSQPHLCASCATVLTTIDFPIPAKPSSAYIWHSALSYHKYISVKTTVHVPSKQVGCAWLV